MIPRQAREPLLRPGFTCWRVLEARRLAVLVDASSYFSAMRAAIRDAQQSILLLGWDFDPHVPLEPGAPGLEGAERLCDVLARALAARPRLQIHILIWNMAWPFAIQRRDRPQRAGRWLPKERLSYRVDGEHPHGAAHHQKVLVVDDSIAFCGGSDFTRNRWDTPQHLAVDVRRRTVDGRIFGPRHDVEIAVDGAAAAGLADLARERWRLATSERLADGLPERFAGGPADAGAPGDVWPAGLEPDFVNVRVGIARTVPAHGTQAAVREVEALYLAAIACAREWIYLENQYVTSPVIGDALIRRLDEPEGPEVVVVCPAHGAGPIERLAMDRARKVLIQRLQTADRYRRFRAFAPFAADGVPITVHSKVMIVDDRLMRIGSANLNNRSLGLDSECDVAVEAAPDDRQTRQGIRAVLHRLVAEHVAHSTGQLRAAMERAGSLAGAIDELNPAAGRRLVAFEPQRSSLLDRAIGASHPFDPFGADDNWRPWRRRGSRR